MASPAENGEKYTNGGSYRQQENYYTQEDAVIVDKAKKTHRETTHSAQRALKVVLLTYRIHCKILVCSEYSTYDVLTLLSSITVQYLSCV